MWKLQTSGMMLQIFTNKGLQHTIGWNDLALGACKFLIYINSSDRILKTLLSYLLLV